jgi:lysyl endopeptidase
MGLIIPNRFIIKTFLFGILFPNVLFAQIFERDIPSKKYSLTQASIPSVFLPSINNDSLQLADYAASSQYPPFRFASLIDVDIDIINQSKVDTIPSVGVIKRLIINSPNAYGFTILFNFFELSEGSSLYIYDLEMTNIFGPFSKEHSNSGVFSTPSISGNTVVIELLERHNNYSTLLNIFKIGHIYKNIFDINSTRGEGQSCDRNINVECPEGNGWYHQIRSVARMINL